MLLDEQYQAVFVLWGTKIGVGIILFVVFWIGAGIVQKITQRLAKMDSEREDVLNLVGRMIRATILGFGLVVALATVGVDVTALIAGLGLTGFAIGFALKDILSSAVAGLIILLNRPFRRGDQIKVADFEGTVKEIDLRYTTLTKEGIDYLVPNSTVMNSPVTVFSRR